MIDPKEMGMSGFVTKEDRDAVQNNKASEVDVPFTDGRVVDGGRLTDGGVLHLIEKHHALEAYIKHEPVIRRLFNVLGNEEADYLLNAGLLQGVIKLVIFEHRGYFGICALNVTHDEVQNIGVLRFWKPSFFRPGPQMHKFINEYAASHGCKAVDYINAPLRSIIA